MKRTLLTFLSIGVFALVWEGIAWQVGEPEWMPPLRVLACALGELAMEGTFYASVGVTCLRACLGLGLSCVASLLTAGVLHRSEAGQMFLAPWLALMRSVPVISFILLALIFLDTELIPLLIAFLTMYPLLTENLLKGFAQLRPERAQLATQFHLSTWNRLTQILYPQLRPFLFSGLASAMGFGWRAIIMGEVLAQCTQGIGSGMKMAQVFIDVPGVMAWTLVAILLGWVSDKGIARLSRWQPPIHYINKERVHSPASVLHETFEARHLSYRFGVKNLSFDLRPGKIYAISAPSGAGKTTLLRLLNGTYRPTGGTLSPRLSSISNVYQAPTLLPHLTALENIALGGASCYPGSALKPKLSRLVSALELDGLEDSLPEALSYGQQQRVALARALLFPASLLLLDEPFKGLDVALRARVIHYFLAWQRETGTTILFTSHSKEEIYEMGAECIPFPSGSD